MDTDYQELDQKTKSAVDEAIVQLDDATLYKRSVHEHDNNFFFMVREGLKKYLIVVATARNETINDFTGTPIDNGDHQAIMKCDLNRENAEALRKHFDFTRPVLIGKTNSYGFGDRLGNAGSAHIRAVRESNFKPVLAQQSIRELERTGRTARQVMDAASWAVFQEGYHQGFGADGDHLKTTADIDRMVKAGYTMFTIDPSNYVVNEVSSMDQDDLEAAFGSLPWELLEDTPDALVKRFLEGAIELRDGYVLKPARVDVLRGMVKYGNVIAHTKKMVEYINSAHPEHPAELELSVDETDEPTTLFEHYLVASELNRIGVELVSLAPRFCGHFEKGIDFKGDLDQFRDEYVQHLAIADLFGGYKLSIHSGSDKFSVYEVIGALDLGAVHVKTAGTSYLEALRTVAEAEPQLFREILSFSVKRFNEDKKTYHISADPKNIPDLSELGPTELVSLLDDDDARQVLHVAYGSVLSGKLPEAKSFKQRLMIVLETNESLHESNLVRHFRKHLQPFG